MNFNNMMHFMIFKLNIYHLLNYQIYFKIKYFKINNYKNLYNIKKT